LIGAEFTVFAVIIPILGAVLTPFVARLRRRPLWGWAMTVATAFSTVSILLILRVASDGPFSYRMGGWEPPWGIEFRFDEFSSAIGVVCLVGLLAIWFSRRYVEHAIPNERIPYFYMLILLDLGAIGGVCMTGDLFNLFVFVEILSLSSYALVAISGQSVAEMAAFKYLIMGAVSSLLILFSTGMLYALTGTLNMADLAQRLPDVSSTVPAAVAMAGFTLGFSVKAALFPLHVWLPDAHSIAPSPVSAILSGLVVKVGVLGMIRLYQVYYKAGLVELSTLNTVLTWLGAISIVMGALFAITQEDIKMMLAYSTISNIGYIFMGLGLASQYSLIGATVHIFNHALIKTTLFLGAGAIIYKTGYRNLRDLRGIGKGMPITSAVMAIGAVAVVGIPPTAGFLCKWYITLGAIEAGKPFFAFVLVFGALLIFVYYIRMINAFYFQEPTHPEVLEIGEVPMSMLTPLVILAILCLVMGVFGRIPLIFIEPAVATMLAPLGG